MSISTHDHVGSMEFSSVGCRCLTCGQVWVIVADPPNQAGEVRRKLVAVPYDGSWPSKDRRR